MSREIQSFEFFWQLHGDRFYDWQCRFYRLGCIKKESIQFKLAITYCILIASSTGGTTKYV